ncbi:Na+/H+ antiporter NhaC [Anaerosacchariphilus polymeriproducens]|uniref:Na+/H+ antiporter NhaC n=1 Tax=Anaerosacchariphilus polymeriproducens TaxID=1812858 RepID=A0A371AZL1_9FIRM|nr:Na+/H+ antiporter NhaC [Anaerosacchariphilus polymeriproducens]RDU25001.1 Na+/H+ antiporter NhaC [Anaerosacchariphilus polymeriproducens]
MKSKKRPNLFQSIFVLGGFLFLAFLFNALEIKIHLAIFCAWFLAMFVGKMTGHSYKEMEYSVTKGIYNGMDAVLILLSVGVLVGTWISGGIVPSLIYYGLKVIHPSIFLLTTLIICSLTSVATGTSWGTAGTAGIAMMGIGAGLGIPAPITAGAVLSGAYFGDNLSPLSDSTILTASMCDIDVMDHVKGMFPLSLIGYIMSGIAFTITGFIVGGGKADLSQINQVMNSLDSIFNISLISFVPMLVVIVLLILKMPSLPVIFLGSGLGIVWGIIFQGLSPVSAISSAWAQIPSNTGIDFVDEILKRGGMNSMLESVGIIILGLGFGGLLDQIGIIKVIADKIDNFIHGGGMLTISSLIVGFLGNLFGSAMYVSIILTPKVMAPKYDELGYSRKILSRNTEFGGTLTAGMIPWSDNGIFMAGILGVSTLQYLPYMWLVFSCIIVAIIGGFTGLFMWDNKNDVRMSVVNNNIEK